MMSGMRNAPPISISSPRETIASRPRASVLSTSSTAAALLLTTVASSAPVSSQSRSRTMIVALAAPAASQIELKRNRIAHRDRRRLDRLLGDQRAAEIGMQHGAGEVEDRAQVRSRLIFKARGHTSGEIVVVGKIAALARFCEHLAYGRNDGGAPETLLCLNQCGVPHHLVDRGSLRNAAATTFSMLSSQKTARLRPQSEPDYAEMRQRYSYSRTLRVTWSSTASAQRNAVISNTL